MIELKGLTKRFRVGSQTINALDSLDLSIGAGEVFGFIGPNGAGKSTTMKILAGLLAADEGTAIVAGCDTRHDGDQIRRNLGYMPDFLGVYDDLTVDEYLQFFAAAFRIPRARRRAVVDQVLELTDLSVKRNAMVDSLSRGMQQRLGIARVLIHDPKVLLLDEPASGLDPRARIEMRSLITELGKMGKTIMVSSHILTELGEMCTSLGMIERGKLLFAGSLEEAFARARAAGSGQERVTVVLEATGESPKNVIADVIKDHRVASATQDTQNPLTISIQLAPGEHGHHFLLARLLANGARVHAFTPEVLKLEDAFLRLTTGALQ